jgi:hypothetical protein
MGKLNLQVGESSRFSDFNFGANGTSPAARSVFSHPSVNGVAPAFPRNHYGFSSCCLKFGFISLYFRSFFPTEMRDGKNLESACCSS